MIIQYTARKYDAHQYFDPGVITYVSDNNIWSDVSTNASSWNSVDSVSSVWDAGASKWDLTGNVYNSVWDGLDDTYSDASTNSVSWSDA